MRIAETHRPYFLPRTLRGDERIVVWNAVASVLAHHAGRRLFPEVGNDPQNLPAQVIEPLRREATNVFLLAGTRVPDPDVHDAPVRIAAMGGRVERHLTERMNGW